MQYDSTHENGWAYTDYSYEHLQFYGPLCDRLMAAVAPAVTVAFLCVLP